MADHERFDVAIVGGGPTGIVAANLLGQAGHRTVVLERAEDIYHLPRAAHFDAEVMRLFQSLGLAERIAPLTAQIGGMEFVRANGERIFGTVERGTPVVPTRQGWPGHSMFYQPELERVLREGAARHPSVELRLGQDVEGITIRTNDATLDVHDLARGVHRPIDARFVLGCDGARSGVRRQCEIRFEDLGFDQRWLVIDTLVEHPEALPRITQQVCDPARRASLVPSVGRHYRWEFQLRDAEDPAELERPESVHALLGPWSARNRIEVIRAVVYAFHGLVADRWREGPVFLLGDAAHQMPPFLGQGMCQGMRDAWNLVWKLDRVLRGRAPNARAVAALLDSYETERAPNARAVVETAVAVGRLIEALALGPANAGPPANLPLSGGRRAYRDELELPKLVSGLLAPELVDDGPVGRLLPQPRLRSALGGETRLDALLGDDFAVVAPIGPRFVATERARGIAERIGARWLDLDPADDLDGWLAEWFEANGAALVRPDRCVFASAENAEDLDAGLDQLAAVLEGRADLAD